MLETPEGLAASSHYSYDLNGNLIGDTGKGITQIDYNLLNLPVKVTGQGGGILEFEYTFGGEKIRKNNEYEREYVGGLEYKNNLLELIHFPNGRIDKTGTVDTFQYYLTDHLGNIVVLFQDTDGDGAIALEEETNGAMDEVIQRNYYYSFGLRVDSPDFQIGDEPKNRYLYNGKELNEELDLNWLAYGFRWYDPAVGRFPSVDPLADRFAWVSPFNYAENEPIGHIDLWGLQKGNFNWVDSYSASQMTKYNGQSFAKNYEKIRQERFGGPITKGQVAEAAKMTDANDAILLMSALSGNPTNIDGTEANWGEVGLAAVGIFLPIVSGSGIKSVIKLISTEPGMQRSIDDLAEKMKHIHSTEEFENTYGKIEVLDIDGDYYIHDGHHRALAAEKAEVDFEVPIEIIPLEKSRFSTKQEVIDAAENTTFLNNE